MTRIRGLATIVAALAWTTACAPDEAPRIVSTNVLSDTEDVFGPHRIVSVVIDERRVDRVEVFFAPESETRTNEPFSLDTAQRLSMPPQDTPPDNFVATLPGFERATVVNFRIVAEDNAGHRSIDPPETADPYRFVVGNVPSEPELLAVWPNEGPTSGGTEVLLVGRDFREGLVALFERAEAMPIEVMSRTQARVRTPPGPEGPVDVQLINPDGGAAQLLDGFTYFPAPEILEVVPPAGPTTGGTEVRIFGRRFQAGSSFLFDGFAASNVQILSDIEATARTPAHGPGFVTVRVEHPTRGFGERRNAYEYIPPPEILAIEPGFGPDFGGTEVQITGRFFRSNTTVAFDDLPGRNVTVESSQTIRVTTPPHPEGFADVTVSLTVAGQTLSDVVPDGFRYVGPPELTEVILPFSPTEGGAQVALIGRNLLPETLVLVTDAPNFPAECEWVSLNELRCLMPPNVAGPVPITVVNPDGRQARLDNALTYFELRSVTPDRGPAPGGTVVLVEGRFLPPALTFQFGAARASCNPTADPDQWRCTTPAGPPHQFVDVTAQIEADGQTPSTLTDGYFYVGPPEIARVTPSRGPLRGGTLITLDGGFFQPGAQVLIGNLPCNDLQAIDDRTLRCRVPPGSPGRVAVTVLNPDGQVSNPISYEYVPVTFEPRWGLIDGWANLTVRGVGFLPAVPGMRVLFGGQLAAEVQIVDDETMQVRIPPRANPGPVTVTVQFPGEPNEVAPDPFSYRRYVERTRPSMAGRNETSDVLIADLDNDGDNDLVYVNRGVQNDGEVSQVLENRNNGTMFVARNVGLTQTGNEGNLCDINGDGLVDMIWGVNGPETPYFINQGGFQFQRRVLGTGVGNAFEAAFFDINLDGRCDAINLAIANENQLFLGDGAGNFNSVNGAIPHQPSFEHDHKLDVGDLDGDGDVDLVVVVDDVNFGLRPAQRHRIYLNNGNEQFSEDNLNRPLLEILNGDVFDVHVADIDGDNDFDILAPNFTLPTIVLINDGTGRFVSEPGRMPGSTGPFAAFKVYDIEGDGDVDVYLVALQDVAGQPSALFLNDGTGTFHRATRGEPQGVRPAYRVGIGDINRDDTSDIVLGAVFSDNQMYWAEE